MTWEHWIAGRIWRGIGLVLGLAVLWAALLAALTWFPVVLD